jgi:imidazolonepropionase-like amidohydrolase
VALLAGTDTGTPYCFPGFARHDELALLVQAGFSPMQALQAATVEPARYPGVQDSVGTVRPRKVADLVILDANPLTNIRPTQKIHAVLVRGRLISAEQRARMLTDVETAAKATTGVQAAAACACTGGPMPTG